MQKDYVLSILLRSLLIFSVLLQPALGNSQNLVVNPSFEEFHSCPHKIGMRADNLIGWSAPTEGTTDYFNKCSATMGVPHNFNGNQHPDFGKGYLGLYLMGPNDYREYAQGELMEPLVKDVYYNVSFYISLAEKSNYGIKHLGLILSNSKVFSEHTKALKRPSNSDSRGLKFVEVSHPNFFADKKKWMFVSSKIKAKGGERYLVIGNFRNNHSTAKTRSKGVKNAAYYYLDMVSVVALEKDLFDQDLTLNSIYPLKGVLFRTDAYELDVKAKESLLELSCKLKTEPLVYVTIHAHTDSDGSVKYNKLLSKRRAWTIRQFLIAQGIAKERLNYVGHGGEKPLADNSHEAGKQKNRRAEFEISKSKFITLPKEIGTAETLFSDEN